MSDIENVAMHMAVFCCGNIATAYAIKQFLCSIKMMPILENQSESEESRKIGELRSCYPEAHRSRQCDPGIRNTGCLSSPGTQHAGAARIFGIKKEMGCLHNPPHVWCEERTRSRRRDPDTRNTGCLSSPGVQHAGAVLVLGTKKEIGRLRDLSHIWCPEEDSNLHTLRHTDLNRARLPIPPSGLQFARRAI